MMIQFVKLELQIKEVNEARSIKIRIHGVPAYGIIDMATDTIVGAILFREVASVGKLRKNFKPADKTPCAYNRQSFNLDGRMDLDITVGDRTILKPVYIKMDAPDQLLFSEGVCRQLDIVTYHKDVCTHKGKPSMDKHRTRRIRLKYQLWLST